MIEQQTTSETQTKKPQRGNGSELIGLVSFLNREFWWFFRRMPIVFLMSVTWASLGVSSDTSALLMTICGCGYFVTHRYLSWIESRYES